MIIKKKGFTNKMNNNIINKKYDNKTNYIRALYPIVRYRDSSNKYHRCVSISKNPIIIVSTIYISDLLIKIFSENELSEVTKNTFSKNALSTKINKVLNKEMDKGISPLLGFLDNKTIPILSNSGSGSGSDSGSGRVRVRIPPNRS